MQRRGTFGTSVKSIYFTLFTLALFTFPSPESYSGEKLLLMADWVLYGQHAPYISAIRRGFFKEGELDVTIQRGYGSGETIKSISLAKADFGVASMGPLAIARARGTAVKHISMQGHRFVQGIFYLKGSGLSKPKDFEGKRMGGPVGSADRLMLPIFCKVARINCDSIQWIPMDATSKIPALMGGRVDAMPEFYTSVAQYENAARATGKQVTFLAYADWGLDIYSFGIVASDQTIQRRPKTVQNFVNAVIHGWDWAYRNPEAALDELLRHLPEINRDVNRRSLQVTLAYLFDGLSEKQGIGVMDREKVRRTIEVTFQATDIKAEVNPEDVFTNEFAIRVPEQWRFPKGKP